MKIDFKQPKYILPLILLPFMLLLNSGMQSFYSEEEKEDDSGKADLQESVGKVSDQVRNRGIDGKLDAFRSRYKRADGYTAIKNMRVEVEQEDEILSQYNEAEKRMLDSIDLALKNTLNQPGPQIESRPASDLEVKKNPSAQTDEDELILQAINQMESQQDTKEEPRYADPMDLFRAQMALVDSISKANDPALQVAETEIERETQVPQKPRLKVSKTSHTDKHFNTVRKVSQSSFIQAIVDQEIRKGTLGERIRIRLLEDIQIGARELPKGTYLYAWISGYEAQRVKLTVSSVMVGNEILPIALNIYDQDGMEGLYVPASSFREFSKDLGGNVTGGMNLQMNQGASSMNQMYLSALQKVFTSSSQAMSKRIRQNKANLKYGTVIYLIDPEQLNPDILSN
ncbi:conjugative transposon protein TraM [Cyclobacterium sp. 1_MG-2023]|uniref:conjugative transposon protein TraM n=1 Tax=Cyclobacterium sp. 1_MG-2023 TaxID=3062681 RepID=UPI0026E1538C|nr:conjugative transposon protein TraM [Cyclobacterium sp. 1_MG-2023]MDO6437041.1 conjugative transposon protein TraM [Cyclobacterium sp. 1_MG-2023]